MSFSSPWLLTKTSYSVTDLSDIFMIASFEARFRKGLWFGWRNVHKQNNKQYKLWSKCYVTLTQLETWRHPIWILHMPSLLYLYQVSSFYQENIAFKSYSKSIFVTYLIYSNIQHLMLRNIYMYYLQVTKYNMLCYKF